MNSNNFKKLSDIANITKIKKDTMIQLNPNHIFMQDTGSNNNIGSVSKTRKTNECFLIDSNKIDPEYLFEQLTNKQREISNYACGTCILQIKKNDIDNIMIQVL